MRVARNVENLEKLILKNRVKKDNVSERVGVIIDEVRRLGDEAVVKFTKKFDGVKLLPKELKVSETEISAAFNVLNSELISAFRVA
ncbi:MAG: histidinol dehydrogenase, partial [Candidatus Omnitrophota bacterium]